MNITIFRTLGCSISIFLLSTNSIYAADVSDLDSEHHLKIRAAEKFSLDSNPLRLSAGSDTLMGSETKLGVMIGDITPTHQVYLDSLVNINRYDTSSFNTVNFHENLGLFKSNQRWLVGAEGRFDYDTTRTSEVTSFGIAIPRVRSSSFSVTPQISFKQNAIDKWALNSRLAHVEYDNSAFIDYKAYSINPSYSHNFDPNNAGIIILNFQRYESDNATNSRMDSVGPSLGWTSIINDELNTKITAGLEKSERSSSLNTDDDSRLNYVFSASANFKGLRDIASITASRSQQQFGNGNSALLTAFDIKEAHSLNEKITLNGNANYSYTNYSSPLTINLDNQVKISGGIDYHLFQEVDLTSSYQYLNQKLTGTSDTIKEQILLIGIEYHPNYSPL